MDPIASHVAAGVVMLLVGLALRELEWRAKIVWWSPHWFVFNVPAVDNAPPVAVLTHAITIQNLGRRQAAWVEIVHKQKPDHFKLQPALDYNERTTPAGEHVLRIESIGPKEHFTVQFLSYKTLPELQYIRSEAGHAKSIPTQPMRVFPKWFNGLVVVLFLVGGGFILYWLVRVGMFLVERVNLQPG